MSWKRGFTTGVQNFRKGEFELALGNFNQALEQGGQGEYLVYDSRSAVLEKLGRRKEAITDARKTIELAPEQWQGYARAARLFLLVQKFDAATKVVNVALQKFKDDDSKRRQDFITLKNDIAVAQDEYVRRTTNQWTHLPVELFNAIALTLVEEKPSQVIPLSLVCKDWRSVVGNNPRLWGTLVLGRFRPHIKAKHWIERSQGNIHTLQVRATACDRASLTSLLRYEFGNEDRSRQPPFHDSWPVQHLALRGAILPQSFSTLSERSLTSIVLRRVTGHAKLILESHPNLETLVLDRVELPLGGIPETMSDLKQLEIRQISRQMLPILNLPMPQLNSLHIESSPYTLSADFDSLRTKSSGNLTTLILRGMPMGDPTRVIELLKANPLLATFELSSIHAGAVRVVEALGAYDSDSDQMPSDPSEAICPLLTHLDFSDCNDMRTGPLVRLTRMRNGLAAPSFFRRIESLIVNRCEKLEPEWNPWFSSNIDNFRYIYANNRAGYRR
ncbi:hypothetical protein EST38_g1422 [Candolleomyces aberdarensis]|uniref:Uncharacterized protein n=1 Tax=Candolleomyces aberdarensis TaxID=2316362 RepID=A0A4Q2DZE9_9AGAR|nr:hypothetical protein EST38_g1422 [Candolleomyces aberdarensis]